MVLNLINYYLLPNTRQVKVVCVSAGRTKHLQFRGHPVDKIIAKHGEDFYSWYDFLPPKNDPKIKNLPNCGAVKGIRGKFAAFLDLIQQEWKVAPKDVMYMGFSQGGSVAIDAGLYGKEVGEITSVQGFFADTAEGDQIGVSFRANPTKVLLLIFQKI